MGDQHTAPAEAYAPDPDRADPDSPDLMPEWFAYLIALVILFLLTHCQAVQQRRARRLASRSVGQPALPRDPEQAPAASIDTKPDDETARTCRGRGAAPACPELLRALKALFDRYQQPDGGPSLWSQLEACVPSLIGPDAAATPTAPVPSPRLIAKIRSPRKFAPIGPRHSASPAPWRHMLARAGTGPPTGPPSLPGCQSCYA
jgi:hypothetical protein